MNLPPQSDILTELDYLEIVLEEGTTWTGGGREGGDRRLGLRSTGEWVIGRGWSNGRGGGRRRTAGGQEKEGGRGKK